MSTGDVSALILRAGLYTAAEVGDTNLDPQADTLDLLSGTFVVEDVNGIPNYFPAQPGLKSGGVWDDPANRDGRELSFSAHTNVTEVITLIAKTGDMQGRHATLRKLNLYALWARKYNEDTTTDPRAVSLEYSIEGGVGSQYAQVFNIEINPETDESDTFSLPHLSRITLTIERGTWQGIPIGASPRMWTLEAIRSLRPTNASGAQSSPLYNYLNLDLMQISPGAGYEHAAEAQIFNACEYGSGAVGSLWTNFIDIPSSVIGGDTDCPALIVATANPGEPGVTTPTYSKLYIGLKTNAQDNPGSSGRNIRNTYNGGDATATNGTGVTMSKVSVGSGALSQERGIRSNNSNTNRHYLNFAVAAATANTTTNASWSLDAYSMRGSYNVYFRGGTDAGGSTAQMRLRFFLSSGGRSIDIGTITPPELVSAEDPQLVWVGTLTLPLQGGYQSSGSGLGNMHRPNSLHGGALAVSCYRSAGSGATNIRLFDVILMPYDEGACVIRSDINMTSADDRGFLIDSTEYISRGNGGAMVYTDPISATSILSYPLIDQSGRPIKLKPGRTNRLYFLAEAGTTTFTAKPNISFRAIVHPVPRWVGLRDV